MIRAVLIVVVLVALLFLLRVLLAGSVPRRSGLAPDDLFRYAAHLAEALDDRGRVEVESRQLPGTLVLEKRECRESPPRLIMRLHHTSSSRRWLARAVRLLADAGIPHSFERTRVLRVASEVVVPIDTSSPRVVNSGATPVGIVLAALGVPAGARLTLTFRGPFRPGFQPEDGEVLPHPLSYRVGVGIGRALAGIWFLLRDRDR